MAEAVAEEADLAKGSDRAADEWHTLACLYAVASDKTADRKADYTVLFPEMTVSLKG